MKNEVPQQIVEKLIKLGSKGNLDDPSIASDFKHFRSYDYLGRIHWSGWYPVCKSLSIDEHIALLKAVVLAMRYSGWDGGSVAAGIWVFKKLEVRISNKQAAEIANWVIKRSDNPWMPFGTQRDRELFVANKDIDTSEDRSGSMLMKLKFIEAAERAQREQTQNELQKQQQAAKIKRLELKQKEAEAHRIRSHNKEEIRKKIITEGEQLDTVSRLLLIIQYKDMPVHSFPPKWANLPKENLKYIDKETKETLIKRMSRCKKGPWKLLRDSLEFMI